MINGLNGVNNCYRAILAQVNLLDSVYQPKYCLKVIYEELTELAFYLMEDDYERVDKGISQLQDTIRELTTTSSGMGDVDEISYIIGEINTHLNYLMIECNRMR